MNKEIILRLIIFIFAALLHVIIIFFVVINVNIPVQRENENARVMKLTDFIEYIPTPPPPVQTEIIFNDPIAETVIETEIMPEQETAPQNVQTVYIIEDQPAPSAEEYFFPMHQVSAAPKFNDDEIASSLVYPPIALRSGLEGRVLLELYVDRTGNIVRINILREEPQDRGFGEAAVRALTGRRGEPAYVNGEPVSARVRYPVSFRIR